MSSQEVLTEVYNRLKIVSMPAEAHNAVFNVVNAYANELATQDKTPVQPKADKPKKK